MSNQGQLTLVMVDDNADEIFLTRKLVRRDGIINNFVSQRKPEDLFDTLYDLGRIGADPKKIVVLLDINMPREDGFETLKKIRRHSTFKEVPVIMLSASDNEADVAESFSLGANGYLVKPFRGDEFFAALNNLPQIKYQLVQAAG